MLHFDASAAGSLRDILPAIAVYAVGENLLREQRHKMPGAVVLLDYLGKQTERSGSIQLVVSPPIACPTCG